MALPQQRWSLALRPLANAFAERFLAHLPQAAYPVRTGTHACTAFALRLAADYAEKAGDGRLLTAMIAKARNWYRADQDAQAWEPSGEDFLSPVLIEAACMARLLLEEDFRPWFDRFLPKLAQGDPRVLFEPVRVSDRTDGKIAHLDG